MRIYPATDGANAAGLTYLRVPLGASDFSASGECACARLAYVLATDGRCGTVYSFDDTSGDTSLANFNINKAPSYLFSVINDIQSVNPYLKVHILPWSPVSPASPRYARGRRLRGVVLLFLSRDG